MLIKMINSASAFPVELVYATQSAAMSAFGSLSANLPRPDMIVTHTQWDVYVPPGLSYSPPQTNMELLAGQVVASVTDTAADLVREATGTVGEPLHIKLPTQGCAFDSASCTPINRQKTHNSPCAMSVATPTRSAFD